MGVAWQKGSILHSNQCRLWHSLETQRYIFLLAFLITLDSMGVVAKRWHSIVINVDYDIVWRLKDTYFY